MKILFKKVFCRAQVLFHLWSSSHEPGEKLFSCSDDIVFVCSPSAPTPPRLCVAGASQFCFSLFTQHQLPSDSVCLSVCQGCSDISASFTLGQLELSCSPPPPHMSPAVCLSLSGLPLTVNERLELWDQLKKFQSKWPRGHSCDIFLTNEVTAFALSVHGTPPPPTLGWHGCLSLLTVIWKSITCGLSQW